VCNTELDQRGCCFWSPKSCWGASVSLLPVVLSGNRTSVSTINHPGRNSDFHMETFLSETSSSPNHCYIVPGNDTQISEFLILGLSKEPELAPIIFGLLLSMHLITVFGNMLFQLLVLVSWFISSLHFSLESLMVLWLSFCTNVEILHFFFVKSNSSHLPVLTPFLMTVTYFAAVLLAGGPFTGGLSFHHEPSREEFGLSGKDLPLRLPI
ncbi:hypothetical protein HPG69_018202, partial [Diceros bicornis minor]